MEVTLWGKHKYPDLFAEVTVPGVHREASKPRKPKRPVRLGLRVMNGRVRGR